MKLIPTLAILAACPTERPALGELFGAGICDFCGEHAPQLRVFNCAPAVGMSYCRKCAPEIETDADWQTDKKKTL